MKILDLTLPTPEENLALDEALLDLAEEGQGGEVLRFWESQEYFVVVGYANQVGMEVNREACQDLKIPILRRCSGGGTVVQGPGCLNYTLILNISSSPELATVPQTNHFIMERQAAALRPLLPGAVTVQGHTDLVWNDLKFSGNAQRRKRHYLIFHGTFLLNFDLKLVESLLPMPSREPVYRQGRRHRAFLTNIPLSAGQVRTTLREAWSANETLASEPDVRELVKSRYGSAQWNFKF